MRVRRASDPKTRRPFGPMSFGSKTVEYGPMMAQQTQSGDLAAFEGDNRTPMPPKQARGAE